MRVVCLADTQIPSRATNGIQIVRMCAALAGQGADVTLVHPHRFGNRPEGFEGDLWSFYGVPESFRIVTLPTPLTLRLSGFKRFARVARGLPLAGYVLWRSRPGADRFVFYCRSLLGAWMATRATAMWGKRSSCDGVFLELHDAPSTDRAWNLVGHVTGVVTNTDALRHYVANRVPAVAASLFTARNGVDLAQFQAPSDNARRTTRARLGADDQTTVVGYTGRVNSDKGALTILDAARLLEASPIRFVLVGKPYDDIAARAAHVPAVTLTGFVAPAEVAAWVAGMDILVMPTSASISYVDFTCPLKLFEYMSSGRPILCADLTVLREVITDEENGLFFQADDPRSLAAGIERLRTDRTLADSIAAAAISDVGQYSWEERAKRVLRFVSSTHESPPI